MVTSEFSCNALFVPTHTIKRSEAAIRRPHRQLSDTTHENGTNDNEFNRHRSEFMARSRAAALLSHIYSRRSEAESYVHLIRARPDQKPSFDHAHNDRHTVAPKQAAAEGGV